jgi:hypothetical protein
MGASHVRLNPNPNPIPVPKPQPRTPRERHFTLCGTGRFCRSDFNHHASQNNHRYLFLVTVVVGADLEYLLHHRGEDEVGSMVAKEVRYAQLPGIRAGSASWGGW